MTARTFAGCLLILAACVPATPPAEAIDASAQEAASGGGCDAAKAQSLVGREQSATLAEEARQKSGARTIRWLRPGQIVTMEYREDRLNLEIDAQGKVTAIRCG
ncbi:MAG: proteinase inhibitor [Alphaproteobacteria bacterium]|nr:proteinase inhibitor [Alphaproteobacteria bacterium]